MVTLGVCSEIGIDGDKAGVSGMKEGERISQEELIAEALRARDRAYAPYSRFRVGAALACDDGRVYTGCNIENASYPAGICAERVALHTAVASGSRRVTALAVVSDSDDPCYPCGICAQVISELAPDVAVILVKEGSDRRQILQFRGTDLLRMAFGPEHLRVDSDE